MLQMKMVLPSDGSGPKNMGPGRARAINVGLGPGPSLEAGPWAGPGLGPLPINKKIVILPILEFSQNSSTT